MLKHHKNGMDRGHSQQDHGYAYIVLVVAFLSYVIQLGIAWTVGVFFAIFVEVFPNNSGVVALISSLNTAFFYGAGPLTSFLTNKYDPRIVSIIGGLVTSVGLILSSYANNVYTLYITFGIITATFGFLTGGFGALLPVVIIQILELQYMASGYGYALLFEAVGTLLGAPVAGWLYAWTGIYEYSMYLGGSVLVVSGMMMIYPWLCSKKWNCDNKPNMCSTDWKCNSKPKIQTEIMSDVCYQSTNI